MESLPVITAAIPGLKATLRTADWLVGRVKGKEAPAIVNADPLMTAESMVTDPVPVEVTVTDRFTVELRGALPKSSVDVLRDRRWVALLLPCPWTLIDASGRFRLSTAVSSPVKSASASGENFNVIR
jgi:hypothetical protein